MTTHFQKLLKAKAESCLFDGKGDPDGYDGLHFLVGGFDCFLALAGKAMIADGVDPATLMSLFLHHAYEVLGNTPGRRKTPQNMREDAERVLQAALRLHHRMCDDPAKAA